MSIVVDQNYLPIIHAQFTGQTTDADVEGYLVISDVALALGDPYALILEAMKIDSLSATQRRLFAEWIARNKGAIKQLCVGQAYVVPGVLQRMIIRSIFMLTPMPAPYRIVSTTQEAWAWCVAQMEAAKVPFDERVREAPAELVS